MCSCRGFCAFVNIYSVLFVFAFCKLAFESFHGVVNGFFEGVGCLVRYDFGLLGLAYFYYNFFIHCRFGFHHFEGDVDCGNRKFSIDLQLGVQLAPGIGLYFKYSPYDLFKADTSSPKFRTISTGITVGF